MLIASLACCRCNSAFLSSIVPALQCEPGFQFFRNVCCSLSALHFFLCTFLSTPTSLEWCTHFLGPLIPDCLCCSQLPAPQVAELLLGPPGSEVEVCELHIHSLCRMLTAILISILISPFHQGLCEGGRRFSLLWAVAELQLWWCTQSAEEKMKLGSWSAA